MCRQTGILVTEITARLHSSSRSSEETMRYTDHSGCREVGEKSRPRRRRGRVITLAEKTYEEGTCWPFSHSGDTQGAVGQPASQRLRNPNEAQGPMDPLWTARPWAVPSASVMAALIIYGQLYLSSKGLFFPSHYSSKSSMNYYVQQNRAQHLRPSRI